jgi:hypothetical protein
MSDVQQASASAQKPRNSNIIVTESGLLEAQDIDGKYKLAEVLFKSGMIPKSYENPMQVMVAMQFAQELGLMPFHGIRNIAMINGNPSIWGELPLALAIKTGKLQSIEEFIFDKDYNKICFDNKNLNAEVYGAVTRIVHKEIGSFESTFTIDDAEKAGLLNRSPVWKSYRKIMLQRRARSFALKALFPEAIAGLPIAEYDFNYIPDVTDSAKKVNHNGEVDPSELLNEI